MTNAWTGAAALACLFASTAASAAPLLEFTVDYAGVAPCRRQSPAFAVQAVPPETRTLEFSLNAGGTAGFDHGSATVNMRHPGALRVGSVRGVGPCDAGTYVWTLRAFSGSGVELASAQVVSAYPGAGRKPD